MSATVLIVDDSLTVRMDLKDAFDAAGYRAVPCGTLLAGREALSRERVDLVILDVLLPDGDGVSLLGEIRAASGARVPILMLSTEAEVKDRIRGLTTGADEYVGKPYDTDYVIARAAELLRSRESAPAPRATTILVIDDSATFRDEIGAALASAGYSVLVAQSGEEGLRIASNQRPDAILVDGVLPGIDGATVVRKVRLDAALRGTPCLLLTAAEGRAAELQALDSGADAFVRKGEDTDVTLARLAAVLRSAPSSVREATATLLSPKKILAVDDSITYLEALAPVLRGEGYDVVLARSGEEALELLAVQRVDCILLDLLMPTMGGKETCCRIKGSPATRDIPLIMLTALEDRQAMIEGLSTGADDYISKSSDLDVLTARVRAQMRRRQFEDENRRIREELLRNEVEAADARAAREIAETKAALAEELTRKNQELEAFSYSVSHDLRAPLRTIEGFSEILLQDHAGQLDEAGKGHLRRVCAAAQRMSELIDDLLRLARISRAELRRQRVSLSDLAWSVAQELRKADGGREVDVRIQAGLFVEADSHLLRVVLDNLIGNAWKYTSKTPRATIEVVAETFEGATAYVVRDNGPGFNMKYVDKLFRPFQRLHAATDFPGTGIGLATVQRIVDRHGGRVWADATPGAGASFSFTVPPGRIW